MTKNDFYNLALIEAMGRFAQTENPDVAAERAALYAATLIKFRVSDDPDRDEQERHIIEVDENHAQILVELTARIEQLETAVANLQRIIEQNCPDWINKPALYGDEHK